MNWDEAYSFPRKNNDILLVGEILVDIIRKKSKNHFYNIIGGSPFNISKYLTQLGVKNVFYGAVGNDQFGLDILSQIERKHINTNINITDHATSYVVVNQTFGSPLPEFHRHSDNYIYLSDKLINDISFSKILHFTFWPLSEEPSRTTILSLVDKAKANQTLIGFDPNYHSKLDDKQKSGLETVKAIINKVDIIKPSLDDSYRLFGKKTVEEYLDIYENLGAKLIILTLGKDGLIARFNKETIRMESLATEMIDSTGAGDAFWSGLYAGITNNRSIRDSIKLGLLCSAENLKYVGSDIELPEISVLLEKIGG